MEHSLKVGLSGKRLPASEVVVVGCFEGETPETSGLDKRLAAAARGATDRKGWKAALGACATNRSSAPGKPFVAVVGLGRRAELDLFRLGRWLAEATARLPEDGFRSAVVSMPDHPVAKGQTAALLTFRSLALAPYRFDRFRAAKNRRPGLGRMSVVPPAGDEGSYRWARGPARHLAAGIALTRRLGDTPPNVAEPSWMAAQAVELAAEHEMECLELGPEELAARGMGGILAVGGGSKTPPRLVRLRWGEGEPSLAFVGKGVTFDSGGLSLKPSPAMDEMKFDKAGACTVLGLARALAGAGVPGRFSCYLPLAENMPDGASYRPGDIVTCYNGKSVEILNTDAEGRMLLADALSWAEEDTPDSVLDFATLTGACVVALGQGGGGLFTPGDALATELLESAGRSAERLWRLPLWPEFEGGLEGRHADLKNVAGRWGGASSAAAFLAQFVSRRDRWAHFDIAGPAYVSKGPKSFGATGFGVATAFDWALRRCGVL